MIYDKTLDLIGNTPLLRLQNFEDKIGEAEIFVKLEKFNPGGSVKDRAAIAMVEKAESDGILKSGMTIIEPTSGNTGIALAMVGKTKGYEVILTMPETMSKERRDILRGYGAKLVLTEGSKGMKGAIEEASRLAAENGYFMPQQFENAANPHKHYGTTAEEIYRDLRDVDIFIAGVGTGGTITGVGKRLKELKSDIKIIAVEPEKSPVISGGNPGPHKIQGIGAGFVPKNLDMSVIDEIITVSEEDSFEMAKIYAMTNGVSVGISSGAAIHVAIEVAKKLATKKKIVVIAPDGGEKYLSMNIYGE